MNTNIKQTGAFAFPSNCLCASVFLWQKRSRERGSTIIEFTVVAVFFFTTLIAICAGANLYFTHNALVEATRRGARFASMQAASTPAGDATGTCATGSSGPDCGPSLTAIRNYTVYGNAAGTGTSLIGLQPSNVHVQYNSVNGTGFGVGTGSVSVYITGYTYYFVIPGANIPIAMPKYLSTAAGESAGTCPSGGC